MFHLSEFLIRFCTAKNDPIIRSYDILVNFHWNLSHNVYSSVTLAPCGRVVHCAAWQNGYGFMEGFQRSWTWRTWSTCSLIWLKADVSEIVELMSKLILSCSYVTTRFGLARSTCDLNGKTTLALLMTNAASMGIICLHNLGDDKRSVWMVVKSSPTDSDPFQNLFDKAAAL